MAALGLLAALAACGQRLPTAVPEVAEAPLILRADLFGDAYRSDAQLSPRGDRVAFLAPRDGANNLFVLSVGAMDEPRPITDDKDKGIDRFVWAEDSATLLYLQDGETPNETRLYAVATDGTGQPRALTPAGARAKIIGLSSSDPTGVLVELNARDANAPDVVRIDVASGARTTLERNPGGAAGYAHYFVDRANHVRLALHNNADGSAVMFARPAAGGRWTSLFPIKFEDTAGLQPLGFAADGASFLMFDSTGDRATLVRVDATTGVKTVLGESPRADVNDVWVDPATNTPHAFAAEYLRPEWRALDADGQADLDFLQHQLTGDFTVTSRSADNARWIVVESGPTTSPRTYLYERTPTRRLSLLFRQRPNLEHAPLQAMTPIEIPARDGLTLVSYLTLPPGSDSNNDGRPDAPVPLVVLAHDGPWSRASYSFNATHQWLANRGYAVLSVNFRGSTGFGKAFLNAGNREWGGKMQDDLTDAVQWAIQNGVAQSDHVAIVGEGFGGYAVLAALTNAPDTYRCGASFGGPANLYAYMASYSGNIDRTQLYQRIADPRTNEGRKLLSDRSPLYHAGQIRDPLLIAMGAHNPAAPRGEADQITQAMRARGASVTYLVFPDDGASLGHTANRLAYLAVLEHFLGDCLGGRVEPVGGAFENANLIAYEGAVNVPGLSAFARRMSGPPAPAPSEPVSLQGEDSLIETPNAAPLTPDTTASTAPSP